MSLTAGTRLGPYEILGHLGAGGMGEVYRARDAKLNRQVALKILPTAFVSDPDRLARFEREARTLASLSHPNIAALYGLENPSTGSGPAALVMELIEGDDLSTIMARGAIPIDDALPIARQIALALEAAHAQGIVHRDLKPANIKVTSDGVVKVLDFGLAKAVDPASTSSGVLSNSPTITGPGTELGMILGTAAYMSPEQARGKAVDRRADVWAFGVVFFEMLTGRRAFSGHDVTDILASVLKDTISLDQLPADTPPSIRRLLRRCLERDRSDRLDSMTTARLEIADARAATSDASGIVGPAPATRSNLSRLVAVAVVAALAGGAAVATWLARGVSSLPAAPVSVVAVPPIGASPLGVNINQPDVAISPDGRLIVYGDAQGEAATLTIRSLDRAGDVSLTGLGMLPRSPFFSPDGGWLGYFSAAEAGTDGRLMKVPVAGGAPSLVTRVANNLRGASWTTAGVIYFASADVRSGLWRVTTDGGAAEQLTTPAKGELDHVWPWAMPDGKHVLFAISRRNADVPTLQWDIAALDVATKQWRIIQRGGSSPRYLPTGHLTWVNERGLMAVAMDPVSLSTSGDPVRLIADAMFKPTSGAADFSVSDAGTVAYVGGSLADRRSLAWLDLKGYVTPISAPLRRYQAAYLSPDGKRLASVVDDGGLPSLWVYDLARNAEMKLTPDNLPSWNVVWSADGREIFFRTTGPAPGVYRVPSSGTAVPVRIIGDDGDAQLQPTSLAPGGALLVTYLAPDKPSEFRLLTLEPQAALAPLLTEQGRIIGARISPDGRWLAYLAESNNDVELFIRPYPNVSGDRIKIAANGARAPRWAESGRALFYQDGPASRRFWRVEVGATANDIGKPVQIPSIEELNLDPTFDVTADGQRFLVIRRVVEPKAANELRLVFNWFEDVRAKFAGR